MLGSPVMIKDFKQAKEAASSFSLISSFLTIAYIVLVKAKSSFTWYFSMKSIIGMVVLLVIAPLYYKTLRPALKAPYVWN